MIDPDPTQKHTVVPIDGAEALEMEQQYHR